MLNVMSYSSAPAIKKYICAYVYVCVVYACETL